MTSHPPAIQVSSQSPRRTVEATECIGYRARSFLPEQHAGVRAETTEEAEAATLIRCTQARKTFVLSWSMEPFGWYFALVWMLGLALVTAHETTPEPLYAGLGSATPFVPPPRDNAFLPMEGACDPLWTSWPQMQERAIADGTVMVWDMKTSVGNLMRTLTSILPLARLLEVGLVINLEFFPAFGVAFEPALIKWDLDPAPFVQRASEIAKGIDPGDRHALKFADGIMILSDSQLELLASTMRIDARDHAQIKRSFREERRSRWRSYLPRAKLEPALPCAWNMIFRRSPEIMASMAAHSPWGSTLNTFGTHRHYNAWHIRTSDGETETSFHPTSHKYIFHGYGAADVCPYFLSTVDRVKHACPSLASGPDGGNIPVYISSNSKSMARNCSTMAGSYNIEARFVDLGIDARDSHTAFSKNPNTAINAFIDFMWLMDASVVIRSSSSFSTAVTEMKRYHCTNLDISELPVKKLEICLPPGC
ncbi:unnamed protein product [Scytosiphon promiscuus]